MVEGETLFPEISNVKAMVDESLIRYALGHLGELLALNRAAEYLDSKSAAEIGLGEEEKQYKCFLLPLSGRKGMRRAVHAPCFTTQSFTLNYDPTDIPSFAEKDLEQLRRETEQIGTKPDFLGVVYRLEQLNDPAARQNAIRALKWTRIPKEKLHLVNLPLQTYLT